MERRRRIHQPCDIFGGRFKLFLCLSGSALENVAEVVPNPLFNVNLLCLNRLQICKRARRIHCFGMQAKHGSRLTAVAHERTSLIEAPRPIRLWVRVQQNEAFRLCQRAIDGVSPIVPLFNVLRSKDSGTGRDLVQCQGQHLRLRGKVLLVAEEYVSHG